MTTLLSLPCPSVWAANSVLIENQKRFYWSIVYTFFLSRQMALVNEDLPEKENNDILEISMWAFNEIFHSGFFFKIASDYFLLTKSVKIVKRKVVLRISYFDFQLRKLKSVLVNHQESIFISIIFISDSESIF